MTAQEARAALQHAISDERTRHASPCEASGAMTPARDFSPGHEVRVSASAALELVGKRWTLSIVQTLTTGPQRFGALKSAVRGVSSNILSQRLRELENANTIVRRKLPRPADVWVYELTDYGRTLGLISRAIESWAENAT